jgi:hypothetical protein
MVMGFAVRATSYKVAGKHNDYVVVRAHGHFYDDDSNMFLTCRGLLFKSDKTLRLEEASEGTMSLFCRNEQIWFNSEMMRALQGQHIFFDSCGEMAINALEITLKRLDGVEHVKWGLFPSDTPTTYEFLDATDRNAFHQMLEKDPSVSFKCIFQLLVYCTVVEDPVPPNSCFIDKSLNLHTLT